jgi:putative Holliday junction resolvase
MSQARTLLGLDIGQARIGVARGNTVARLASPLAVVAVDGHELEQIKTLVEQETATELVAGLPRGLDGQATAQTELTKQFGERLAELGLPLHWQDEAGTSIQAETEGRGDSIGADARAAAIILQDYLNGVHA